MKSTVLKFTARQEGEVVIHLKAESTQSSVQEFANVVRKTDTVLIVSWF